VATDGTRKYLEANGVPAQTIKKVHEGRPNITDAIKNGEIHLVVNTRVGKAGAHDDSYIRKAAIRFRIPYITTTAAAIATAKGIAAMSGGGPVKVRSLQRYHASIAGLVAIGAERRSRDGGRFAVRDPSFVHEGTDT
jgi:carbamoyl-phosphate synthase large subunit